LLDADIYGPSVPLLSGVRGRKPEQEKTSGRIIPLEAHGVQIMSIGFMVDDESPMIWRGPMVQTAIYQMLRDVIWADEANPLDILIVDMPPGTGDAQLTMAQKVPMAGAIIVSTPQDLALIDARKAVAMFRKTHVPIIGMIENMSTFVCPSCGHESHIFGYGGAKAEAEKIGVPYLGAIPLNMDIRAAADAGTPVEAYYGEIAAKVIATLAAKLQD
jgi:ATP-binding protein involved in chromosome partitioning